MHTGKIPFLALFLGLAGALSAGRVQGPVDLASGSSTRGLLAVDLDGDGVSELVAANFGADSFIGVTPTGTAASSSSIVVFKNSGGKLLPSQTLATGTSPRGLASADLDGDGRPDLLASFYGSDQLGAYYQRADGSFGAAAVAATGHGPVGVDALASPGGAYVAVANNGSSSVSLFRATGGSLSLLATLPTGASPTDLRFIKLAGQDKLVSVNSSGSLSFFSLSDFSPAGRNDMALGGYPCRAVVADFNGDGLDDLAVALFSEGKAAILFQQAGGIGSEAFKVSLTAGTTNGIAAARLSPKSQPVILAADRDADRLDLLRQGPTGAYALALSFTAADAPYPDPSAPSKFGPVEAAFGDFNGDGRVDFAASHMRSGKVKLYLSLPPAAPAVSSSTHPDPASFYASPEARFTFTPGEDIDGIDHYLYALDQNPSTQPSASAKSTAEPHAEFSGLDTGVYYLHVRSVDRAGNIGDCAHFKIGVTAELSESNTYNYPNPTTTGRTTIRFALASPAAVQVRIYDEFSALVFSRDLSQGQTFTGVNSLEWDGRNDRGQPAGNGGYILQLKSGDKTITKKIAIVR